MAIVQKEILSFRPLTNGHLPLFLVCHPIFHAAYIMGIMQWWGSGVRRYVINGLCKDAFLGSLSRMSSSSQFTFHRHCVLLCSRPNFEIAIAAKCTSCYDICISITFSENTAIPMPRNRTTPQGTISVTHSHSLSWVRMCYCNSASMHYFSNTFSLIITSENVLL